MKRYADANDIMRDEGNDGLRKAMDQNRKEATKDSGYPALDRDEARSNKEIPPIFDLTDWNPWSNVGAPPFPVDALPISIRDYVTERAAMTGADVSAWAMSSLVAISVALDHRVQLQPKQHDARYRIHPVLWAVLVGDPSTRKSAPISDVEGLLSRLDRQDAKTREGSVSQMATEIDEKGTSKDVPPARRRVLHDTTTEKLCEILSHQNSGIGLFRDELSGWIGAMEKYGGRGGGAAQDRSVWLKAFASQPYTQDRRSDSRVIEMMSVSILGALQPARLKEMPRLESDGMLQRFLPIMMLPAGPERDEPTNPIIRDRFAELLALLGRLTIPTTFRLSAEASRAYLAFAHDMTNLARTTDPSPDFGTFLGKQARTLGAMALLIHGVDVAEGRMHRVEDDVPLDTFLKAQQIVEQFVIPQGWHFYAMMNEKALRDTQAIAGALIRLAEAGTSSFTQRDLHFKCRAIRGMALQDVQRALAPFDANGWVVPLNWLPNNNRWWLNPALKGRFSDELAEQKERTRLIIARIRGSLK